MMDSWRVCQGRRRRESSISILSYLLFSSIYPDPASASVWTTGGDKKMNEDEAFSVRDKTSVTIKSEYLFDFWCGCEGEGVLVLLFMRALRPMQGELDALR